MIVVDTSVWIDYFCGIAVPHTDLLDYELGHNRVIIGDLIMTELLQGFREDRDFHKARKLLDTLEYRDFAGRDIALKAAVNFRSLRKRGVTIRKTIDVIIATFCIENRLPLLHHDADFDHMAKPLGLVQYPRRV
jgi:predicted nucleic acid-binding protein